MPEPQRHTRRAALVTGAGAGIGRAIARRLAADGCAVACTDVKHDLASATAETIADDGGQALSFAVDVRHRSEIQAALEGTMESFGALHYVVNNAGVVTMHGLADLTDDEWDFVIDVNLKGQFLVAQLSAPFLAASRPTAMVNLSTVEAEVVAASGASCQPHYNASKGGVKMLTKALAVELAGQGTRVNAVAPGPIRTGFIPGVDPESIEPSPEVLRRLLVGRLGEPEDIAAAVSFLLSDDAAFITGTQLVVDGGWLTQ